MNEISTCTAALRSARRRISRMILLLFLVPLGLQGQTIFSRFEFNDLPLTMASIGPNGISADPNATSNSTAAYVTTLCQALKGIDLRTNNASGIYNQPTLGMAFRFRRLEAQADFYLRGGMRFYVEGGQLWITYTVFNATGNAPLPVGPFNTGYTLPSDNQFHVYDFLYTQADGVGRITVDGATIWTNDGPNNRALYWVGAPAGMVGTIMDGNCNGQGLLDYAYFYIPDAPLAVDFIGFEVEASGSDNVLSWTAFNAAKADFIIERSQDGQAFVEIGKAAARVSPVMEKYNYTDAQPGGGTWFYRVRQTDEQGAVSVSETREVRQEGGLQQSLRVWPNPATDEAHIAVGLADPQGSILLTHSTGQVISRQPMSGIETQLDLRACSPGLYLVQYHSKGKSFVQKLLVK